MDYTAANPHLTRWTAAEEDALVRQIDWKIMPVLCVTYALQWYDKAMLSQAALFGLIEDLGLGDGGRYSLSAAIFYLGFMAGAYPSMFLAQRYPVERVAAIIVLLWGICLILTPTCTSYHGLFVQRFFLGALESGVSPMFMMIIGSWYRKNEQAFRIGMWYSLTGYTATFSPLINYGLGHIEGKLNAWTYMYFFAGGITILWSIAIYFFLVPDPVRVKSFSYRAKYILVARLRTNNSGVRNTKWKKDQVMELLTDLKFWLAFWMGCLAMVCNGALSTFMPLVIAGFGFSSLNALLLTMPAGAYCGTVVLLAAYLAMKFEHIRTWIIALAQALSTGAAVLLWQLPTSERGWLLFAMYLLPSAAAGYCVLMGLQIANTAGYTKRALASSGIFVGYCIGNFVGPFIFLEREHPKYGTGFAITWITAAISGLLAIAYRYECIRDNRARNASGCREAFDHAFEDPTDKANKQFRYII
ncbi:allantoate permease [Sphaerulina musiva SO2202]|uniref:Allantoate permease n=1 Tax=Sphaerulina musiva (strain SO2202) TaxID=692275 RepID=N1QEY9_SPHMS|nr:allantoate permease [Sphaerulina musiva SO2202]EMF11753.1 allantoate permease [Sphaerulina musiva SO2202]